MTAEKTLPVHSVCAAGIVKNGRGEVLLMNNVRRGWEFPGGIIECGENIIDGLKREIFEETGVYAEVGELFCVSSNTCSYPGYNGVKVIPPKVILDFICTYSGGEPCPSDESTESGFFPEEEALGMIGSPVYKERFLAYLEYTGRPVYMSYKNKPDFIFEMKKEI